MGLFGKKNEAACCICNKPIGTKKQELLTRDGPLCSECFQDTGLPSPMTLHNMGKGTVQKKILETQTQMMDYQRFRPTQVLLDAVYIDGPHRKWYYLTPLLKASGSPPRLYRLDDVEDCRITQENFRREIDDVNLIYPSFSVFGPVSSSFRYPLKKVPIYDKTIPIDWLDNDNGDIGYYYQVDVDGASLYIDDLNRQLSSYPVIEAVYNISVVILLKGNASVSIPVITEELPITSPKYRAGRKRAAEFLNAFKACVWPPGSPS